MIPVIAAWQVYIPEGVFARARFLPHAEMMRVDKLSRSFRADFCIAAFLGNLYAGYAQDRAQQLAALFYSGSALGAVFAGDLITLFSIGKERRLPPFFDLGAGDNWSV